MTLQTGSPLSLTGVAVEKLTRWEMGEKNFALGSPTNDVLRFPRHFLSHNFPLFQEKVTFSTATGDYTF
jgi:hypothetical protein